MNFETWNAAGYTHSNSISNRNKLNDAEDYEDDADDDDDEKKI